MQFLAEFAGAFQTGNCPLEIGLRLIHILQLYVAKAEILADELLSCDFFRRREGAYVVQNPVLLCASFRRVEDVL